MKEQLPDFRKRMIDGETDPFAREVLQRFGMPKVLLDGLLSGGMRLNLDLGEDPDGYRKLNATLSAYRTFCSAQKNEPATSSPLASDMAQSNRKSDGS